jgi:hypothetical protein
MSQSPTQLGASFWWRCDQGLSLDGSNLVTSWLDVIAGKYLIQPQVAGRPGITSGRYTTTAVNFDVPGAYNPGLYAGATSSSADSAANWGFLHKGTTWHIFVCGRMTNINAARNGSGSRALINNFANVGGSGYNGAWLSWSKSTGQVQSRIYNNNSAIIAGNTGALDPTVSPGTLFEYRLQDDGSTGADLFTVANAVAINSAARSGAYAAGNGGVLMVGCDGSGGYTSPNQYAYPWGGYIEDIVIFNGSVLTGTSLQDLRDWFMENRGVPHGLALAQGNVTPSFTLTGTPIEIYGPNGAVVSSFDTSANLQGTQQLSANFSFSLDTNVNEMVVKAMVGHTTMAIGPDANLQGSINLSPAFPWGMELDGILSQERLVGGDAAFSFETEGGLPASFPVAGDAPFAFSSDGQVEFIFKGVIGNAHTQFEPWGFLDGTPLMGNVAFDFKPSKSMALIMPLKQDIGVGFDLEGDLAAAANLEGIATSSFVPAAALGIIQPGCGNATFGFDPEGYCGTVFHLAGAAVFAFNATGDLVPSVTHTDISGEAVGYGDLIGDVSYIDGIAGEAHAWGDVAGALNVANVIGGTAVGAGDIQASFTDTIIFGGVISGVGILLDPYEVTSMGTVGGTGDVMGTLDAQALLFARPMVGFGSLGWAVPDPTVGAGTVAAFMEVEHLPEPICCPCAKPPKQFRWGQELTNGDLTFALCDTAGNPFSPQVISYAIYKVMKGGQYKQLIGPPVRHPVMAKVGCYYAVISLDCGQPGDWVIVWTYQRHWWTKPECVEEPFRVLDAVLAGGPDSLPRCKKFGWD